MDFPIEAISSSLLRFVMCAAHSTVVSVGTWTFAMETVLQVLHARGSEGFIPTNTAAPTAFCIWETRTPDGVR